MKYDELIKQLRYCGTHDCAGEAEELIGCMAMRSDRDCRNCNSVLQLDAADAIEELLGVIQRQKEMINATAYLPLYQKPKWISVEEKLPDFEGAVLCMRKSHIRVGLSYQEILYFDYDDQWFKDMFRDFFVEEGCITHWMPLPSTEGLYET